MIHQKRPRIISPLNRDVRHQGTRNTRVEIDVGRGYGSPVATGSAEEAALSEAFTLYGNQARREEIQRESYALVPARAGLSGMSQ